MFEKLKLFATISLVTLWACTPQKERVSRSDILGNWRCCNVDMQRYFDLNPNPSFEKYKVACNDSLEKEAILTFCPYPFTKEGTCEGADCFFGINLYKRKEVGITYGYTTHSTVGFMEHPYSKWKIKTRNDTSFLRISNPEWPHKAFSYIEFEIISIRTVTVTTPDYCDSLTLKYLDLRYVSSAPFRDE